MIVLGSRLADRLFPDSDAVGRKLPVESWWGTVEYEVIGVLAPAEEEFPMPFDATADIGFVPISGSTHGPSQRYPSLYIGVDPELDLQHAYEVVQSEVAMKFGEAAAVRSPLMDYQRSQAEQSRTMILVAGLASVGLIVAIITSSTSFWREYCGAPNPLAFPGYWEFPKNDLPAVSFGVPSFVAWVLASASDCGIWV